MATYLIDFENVRSDGLRGINWLSENDTVVIFYSNNADTLTFEAMDLILNSNATIQKYKIARGGKNALDFQLATYLGYLIHENSNPYFYIISKDNGFHYVIDFWKRTYQYEGYVFCCASISEAYSKQKRFDSYSQAEKAAIIEELNQEELDQEDLDQEDLTLENTAMETTTVETTTSETTTPEIVTVEPVIPEAVIPEIATVEPVIPEAVVPKVVTVEPVTLTTMALEDPIPVLSSQSHVLSDEAAVCEAPTEENESIISQDSAKKESKPVSQKRQKSSPKKKTSPEKDTMTEEAATPKDTGKKKVSSKTNKSNLGELSKDLLLPLTSPAVQKAITLTGDLCNEKQAQVAASHLIHSSGKQDFYRKMTAYFGQKHGIAVYNSLRSEYTNMRKNEN